MTVRACPSWLAGARTCHLWPSKKYRPALPRRTVVLREPPIQKSSHAFGPNRNLHKVNNIVTLDLCMQTSQYPISTRAPAIGSSPYRWDGPHGAAVNANGSSGQGP